MSPPRTIGSDAPRTPPFTAQQILDSIKAAGLVTFEDETPYDLNICGVRTLPGRADVYDDWLAVVYRDENLHWVCRSWRVTTCPGLPALRNPSRSDGVAVMVAPQQARGAYIRDLHRGKYLALCNRIKPVKVWRDNNHNELVDPDTKVIYDAWGINVHRARANGTTPKVGPYSEGCTVFANEDDFDRFMDLTEKQIEYHPTWTKFSYTLLTSEHIVPRS